MGMTRSASASSICFGLGTSMFQSQNQDHKVNDEQQHDGHFQGQHPPVVLVVLEQLIEIVKGLELAIDGAMPVAQMKPGGNVFVNAREMPIAKKLGNVGQFIVKPGKVDADVAQFAQNVTAAAHMAFAKIAIGAFQGLVENPVVGFEFGQLKVRQLDHIKRFVEILGLVNDER